MLLRRHRGFVLIRNIGGTPVHLPPDTAALPPPVVIVHDGTHYVCTGRRDGDGLLVYREGHRTLHTQRRSET